MLTDHARGGFGSVVARSLTMQEGSLILSRSTVRLSETSCSIMLGTPRVALAIGVTGG